MQMVNKTAKQTISGNIHEMDPVTTTNNVVHTWTLYFGLREARVCGNHICHLTKGFRSLHWVVLIKLFQSITEVHYESTWLIIKSTESFHSKRCRKGDQRRLQVPTLHVYFLVIQFSLPLSRSLARSIPVYLLIPRSLFLFLSFSGISLSLFSCAATNHL